MIKIEDISHVAFRAPDLDEMARFLADFGLATERQAGKLYARGLGTAPYVHVTEEGDPAFVALGLRAASVYDVIALGKAEGVAPVTVERPGGGTMVVLTDPDGIRVEVIAGQTMA